MESGYEKTYNMVSLRLKDCDLNEAAERVGFDMDEGGNIRADFLNRTYIINSSGVTAEDSIGGGAIEKSILIYYITSKGSGGPAKTYSGMGAFLPSVMRGGVDELPWMGACLLQKWGQNANSLDIALSYIGMKRCIEESTHCNAWEMKVLPRVSIKIIYYEQDEEFPAEIRLLFDDNAGRYFEYEQLAFLSGSVLSAAWTCEK